MIKHHIVYDRYRHVCDAIWQTSSAQARGDMWILCARSVREINDLISADIRSAVMASTHSIIDAYNESA